MKPFKFSLASLHVLRQQRERGARQRYAQALAACRLAAQRTQAATAEWETALAGLGRDIAGGITAGRLAHQRNGCLMLEIRWRERHAAWTEARRVAGLLLEELTAATREREGLDQFHDRARRRHELATQRAGQKQLDELATQRAGAAWSRARNQPGRLVSP